MNELRRRREQRKNGSQMELKIEFESGMRRVEVTDCGSCCRLAGKFGAGAAVGLWQSREEVSKEGPMAHGQFKVWGLFRGQKSAKMGRSRCCLRPLLTDIGDWWRMI